MVNAAAPVTPISSMISDEDWLDFDTSAVFRSPPANLIPFSAFVSKGIYIPPTTVLEVDQSVAHDETNVDGQSASEDLLVDPPVELDGHHQPTMHLKVIHDTNKPKYGNRTNAMVAKISKEDAWKLGKEGVKWAEPKGTSRGEYKADKPPFFRALRALIQFFNSRSLALNKQHHWVASRFRNVTRLRSTILGPHIPGHYIPDPKKPMTEQEDEATGLIRDMQGTMRLYWRKVMEDAGKGWNYIMAMESFEIFNSFLHYLLFHEIFCKTSEAWLHASLVETCRLSRYALKQMAGASMIYDGTINTPSSFQMLARSAWLGSGIDWDEAERKVAANKELGAHFEELRKEVEALRLEEEAKNKDKAQVEEPKERTFELEEDWMHGEHPGQTIAALPSNEATAKLAKLIAPHDPTQFTILKSIALSTCTIVGVTAISASPDTILSILNSGHPIGFVELKLSGPALADESGDPIIIIVDRGQGIEKDEDLQAMLGMRIEARWSKVELAGATTWITNGLRRVAPSV